MNFRPKTPVFFPKRNTSESTIRVNVFFLIPYLDRHVWSSTQVYSCNSWKCWAKRWSQFCYKHFVLLWKKRRDVITPRDLPCDLSPALPADRIIHFVSAWKRDYSIFCKMASPEMDLKQISAQYEDMEFTVSIWMCLVHQSLTIESMPFEVDVTLSHSFLQYFKERPVNKPHQPHRAFLKMLKNQ